MKKAVNKNSTPDFDKFDRKKGKQSGTKNKSSKRKLSIYDEFEDDDGLLDISLTVDDYEE